MEFPKIVGIVNITSDSFSDGGKFLRPENAIAHAKKLKQDGADVIELSGASSNPHSERIPAGEQIARMEAVLTHVEGPISIDATDGQVQRWALSKKVAYLNDIRGFSDESVYANLVSSSCKLIVMHFISDLDKAVRVQKTTEEVWRSIHIFFDERIPKLEKAGIARDRIIIDPGMGFFLARNPQPSLYVLAHARELKARYGLPMMISVSRKSFLKNLVPTPSLNIEARTLAAELIAFEEGVDYIRTHDPGALKEALQTRIAVDSQR